MRPYLVPVDVYRPAAIDQLRTLARQLDIPCFASSADMKPVDIVRAALEDAKEKQCTVVILDTAGRLHIDAPLMQDWWTSSPPYSRRKFCSWPTP